MKLLKFANSNESVQIATKGGKTNAETSKSHTEGLQGW
jgi:hypothetical protein